MMDSYYSTMFQTIYVLHMAIFIPLSEQERMTIILCRITVDWRSDAMMIPHKRSKAVNLPHLQHDGDGGKSPNLKSVPASN